MANKRGRNKRQPQEPGSLFQKYDSINYRWWGQYANGHRPRGKIKQIFSQRLRNKLKKETKNKINEDRE